MEGQLAALHAAFRKMMDSVPGQGAETPCTVTTPSPT
jgi:hypothetical protein